MGLERVDMTANPGKPWTDTVPHNGILQDSPSQYGPFNQGVIDFSEVLDFLRRNLIRISLVTLSLTLVFLVLFSLYPFPYRATALVLVDPRERRVTLTENVLPGIGSDAAFLESVVRIVHSDGFLLPVLEELDAAKDPLFGTADSADERKLLAAFKRKLEVDRVGATFIVEISFSSNDPDKSALYANAVAQAFVDSQSKSLVAANETAASSLQERLKALQGNLEASENAVARFKARNGIINVAEDSTLLQRELISLNEQIVAAKAETEAARARQEKIKTGSGLVPTADQSDVAQLVELRRQRGQVLQTLSEFSRIYGDRHPRVTAERSKLVGIDRQIADERTRLLAIQRERLESSTSALQALTKELSERKQAALETDQAAVALASLEREAAANRRIYEEFLARFKATEEQSGLELEQARIASPALPPLKKNQPSRVLAVIFFGIFSGFCAVVYAFAREFFLGLNRPGRQVQSIPQSLAEPVYHTTAIAHDPGTGRAARKLRATIQKIGFVETGQPRSQADERTGNPYGQQARGTARSSAFVERNLKQLMRWLERGPLQADLPHMLQPGSVVVLSAPGGHSRQSDAALALGCLAALRSVPVLLLTGNETMRANCSQAHTSIGLTSDQTITTINPMEITANHFGNRRSIWEIVEAFSVSNAGRESCMIVDAPPVQTPGQIQRLSEFADYFLLLDPEHGPNGSIPADLLAELPERLQKKLRRFFV